MRDKEEKSLITSHIYYRGLLDKKQKTVCLHDINFIFSRNGLTAFAAFLLSLFVRTQESLFLALGAALCLPIWSFKKFRLEVRKSGIQLRQDRVQMEVVERE